MNLSDYLPNNRYQLIGFFGSLIIRILADYFIGRTDRIKWPAEIELLAVVILRLFYWGHHLQKGESDADKSKHDSTSSGS